MRLWPRSGNLLIFCLLTACAPAAMMGPEDDAEAVLVVARPYEVAEPSSYDAAKPTPLMLLLHAYKTSGELQEIYFGLSPFVEAQGFLLAYPDGTANRLGDLFWNATDACCNLDGTNIDDVAYLRAVLHDMEKRYNVDRQRVFVVGHSNGAFMAHRLACDIADEIAGIVSLAGAVWQDPSLCNPTSPVAVLQIHGDQDDVVRYDGGDASFPLTAAYPSAHETVAQWAAHENCGALADSGVRLDLVGDLPDAETRVDRYASCQGGAVELWTMQGGSHYPALEPAFATSIWTFLTAHPKQ